MKATKAQIAHLEKLYSDRTAYHGELHDHSASGGTSDGMRTLEHWRGAMEALKLDFAAILDHKQVKHMYAPQWSDGLFLGGTEPGTVIVDADAEKKSVHYNMIFENAEPLMELLSEFPEYEFTGGPEGHFEYPNFTRARFAELAEAVDKKGGFFVHPHPKQLMIADDPLQYWFRDGMGIEVIYDALDDERTEANYKLWCDLLALGKKVYATAGCDRHCCGSDTALTTIYANEKTNKAYIERLREGDFVAGAVGIKMCVGDTRMGGTTDFSGKKLIVCAADFHRSVNVPERVYRLDILDDKGIVASKEFNSGEPAYLTVNTKETANFYRAEVTELYSNVRIAIGNPIWRKKEMMRTEHREEKFIFPFVEYSPKNKREGMPIIIQLHGAGERGEGGDDLVLVDKHGFSNVIPDKEFDAIFVMPQCPKDTFWAARVESIIKFIEAVIEEYKADRNRVYLVGLSMGGYGTWFTAMARPDLFAAIAPVCGGGMAWNAATLTMPVWAFHGALDQTVSFNQSKEMIDKLTSLGRDARLTVFENEGHSIQTLAMKEELINWLLSKSK